MLQRENPLQKGRNPTKASTSRSNTSHPSHCTSSQALTCHQVKAFFLLGMGPHLAGEEVQLHRGTVYLQGERTEVG